MARENGARAMAPIQGEDGETQRDVKERSTDDPPEEDVGARLS